jgi:hypothetical protein
LGRFLRRRDQERTFPERRIERSTGNGESASPVLITLSSGQMLLPGTEAPHLFLQ